METVLEAAKQETKELRDETSSSAQDIQYRPQAFTREGRTD